ncbi:MAG TPA: RDD family protein [Thermodesulfobacteriota bacterium]|nr:RDD family protein [Thermodesulfobacteriota bacterium]
MSLDIPSEDLLQVPSNGPSEGRTSRRAKNCSECGMVYFDDELIRFGDALVCGKCKPLFVQKLKEGVAPAGEMVYAGFWIRAGAKFVDGIIFTIVALVLGVLGNLFTVHVIARVILQNVFSFMLGLAYTTYFVGTYGATPGKMACGLKVVRPDGERISYARACGRFFADILSYTVLGIGYLMVALDEERRALHDRICDTRVIKA